MIGILTLVAFGQTAEWRPLALTTPVSRSVYVCGGKDNTKPSFEEPWWQVLLLRDGANDRIKIYQLGDGHTDRAVSLSNALIGYDEKIDDSAKVWRLTYKSGADNLVAVVSEFKDWGTPSLHVVWKRDGQILDRHCWPTPGFGAEWWNRSETWK